MRSFLTLTLPALAAFSFMAAFVLPIVGAAGFDVSPYWMLAAWFVLVPSGVGCLILDAA